ncbi:hypothetical protein [Fulvivirga sediminis]|uniref:Lipoprotein n=1 Tax=Fulvivirga sediminis TaxID=2803949 RepID=A0A937K1I7_9BACT|nr:hypothetical protein [Fulvivirga sediminis]MBL3656712.1 hypothetical protein [Fulvivirga sediminis]
MRGYPYLFFLLILLIGISCGGGVDNYEEVGGGYTYCRDGETAYLRSDTPFKQSISSKIIDIKFNDEFVILSQNPAMEAHSKDFSSDLSYIVSKYFSKETNLDSLEVVTDVFYENDNVDLVSLRNCFLKKGFTFNNSVSDKIISKNIADSILRNDPYFIDLFSRELNFWIIHHKNKDRSIVFGPYSRSQYYMKRKKLNIPNDLVLEIEKD